MNLTLAFIGLVVFLIIAFDFWIIAKSGKKESISAHIIRLSHQYPSIPFLIGFVCGHLFWSMNTSDWVLNEVLK